MDLYLIKVCNSVHMQSLKKNECAETKAIVNKYQDVFQGYGLLPGVTQLEIDENIESVIQKPRRIPVS